MANTKSVLIFGGSGFIGTHIAMRLRESHKVYATFHTHPIRIPGVTCVPLNMANRNWIKRIMYASNPDVIIYVAGSEDVNWAERFPRESEKIHTGGPATIANLAESLQPKFIYLSSCYVFDGSKGNYKETDIVLPGTTYGKNKLGGENYIRGKSTNWLMVRSSPVFGRGNGLTLPFLDDLRLKLERGERFEARTQELHSFVPVSALADFIGRLVESGPRNKVMHFGGLTKLTHFELAKEFAKRFGYDPSLVVQKRNTDIITLNEKETFDYSLNSSQIVESLKVKPLLLEESFDLLEKQLVPGL